MLLATTCVLKQNANEGVQMLRPSFETLWYCLFADVFGQFFDDVREFVLLFSFL